MKTLLSSILTLMAGIILFTGCGGQKQPDGFPDTVAFTLTVTKAGTPLPEADVVLFPDVEATDFVVGGRTDARGIVDLTTIRGSYRQRGIPTGTFKVVVNKPVEVTGSKSQEELSKLSPFEAGLYQAELEKKKKSMPLIVPKKFTTQKTTPLSITVSPRGSATVDINE